MKETTVINLFGDGYIIPENNTKEVLKKLKSSNVSKTDVSKQLKSTKVSLEDRLDLIKKEVLRVLGRNQNDIEVIKTKEDFVRYIDKAIENGIIAVDTETNNSLDPLTCKLMGLCIYTPGKKAAYVPINHVSVLHVFEDVYDYKRLPWQLSEQDCFEQLSRLNNKVKILTHNGKFDYKVLHCTCGWDMPMYWDSYAAARMLDENELSAGLKQQYIDKIDPSQEKYSIDHLFENVLYEYVDPEVFALYAATDALMTYRLYEWQAEKFKDPNLSGVYSVFRNIEMPIIEVVAKMELTGIDVDMEYVDRLNKKYKKLTDECNERLNNELIKLEPKIASWRLSSDALNKTADKKGKISAKTKGEQLENPVNLESPTQLAILVYDILKAPQVSIKSPRGTGVDELTALSNKTKWPIFDLMLEKRGLDKLLNTFIEKLPLTRNEKDGKVHCSFLPLGTDTGRFSSKEPNMQQIPRGTVDIKPMFCAPKGYSLVACDLSAAEVRTAANAAQDPQMLQAYREGQDLYSLIASKIYNNKYEDNLEFYPEGTKILFEGKEVICGKKTHTNKSGKVRRQDSKSVLIGLIYGRGAQSIAEQINESRLKIGEPLITKDDAQQLVDNIYKSFPRLKEWIEETHDFVRKNGYVDDVYGRRRRLPNAMLPKYDIHFISTEGLDSNFNPIIGCEDRVDNTLIEKYKKITEKIFSKKDYEDVKRRAYIEGVEIRENNGLISEAERKAVNFQAQAASSEINKLSMLAIDNDPELKSLGVQLLLTIHDEVIVKCPSENAKKVATIIPNIMEHVAEDKVTCPLKADSTIIRHWYEDDLITVINEEYNKLTKGNPAKNMLPLSQEEAYNKLVEKHCELTPEQIYGLIYEEKDYLW